MKGLLPALDIVWAVCRRSWAKTLRRPVALTFSLLQPMMWMLFFGFLFQRFPLQLDGEGISYSSFLLPGVCAMTVMFGASQSGISLIRDMQTRFLQRMLQTPAGRPLLLGGKLLADCLRLLGQALAVALLGLLVGARISPSAAALAAALLFVAFFAWAFSSLSCVIALKTRTPEGMAAFVHLVNMPVLFTSSALVPSRQMPDWLQAISGWNPLTLTVDALRGALLHAQAPAMPGLVPLALAALILFGLAVRALRKVS